VISYEKPQAVVVVAVVVVDRGLVGVVG